jgi:quinol monooxygenase YgiN
LLVVVAHVRARPGTRAELEAVLRSFVEPSRTHEGCVQYNLHRDSEDDGHFVFYEQWDSQDSLDKHRANEQFASLATPLEQLSPDIDIRLCDLVE